MTTKTLRTASLLLFLPAFWPCVVGSAGEPAATAATHGADGTVLKWEGSYWRYHLVLRPPMVVDETGKSTGELTYYRGWHIGSTQARVRLGDVPAGWMNPGFDDSLWVRQKNGPQEGGSMYDPVVNMACLRSTFEVADPSRVSKLAFDVKYIGGVVVYLNGREIARRNLPAGPLTGDTLAEGYPKDAYDWGIPLNKYNYPADMKDWKAPTEKGERFRALSVPVDSKLLVKGANVLAVAIHRAGHHPAANKWSSGTMNGHKGLPWPHLYVLSLSLKADPGDSVTRPVRPAGVQVWSEDIHQRVVNRDWAAADARPAVVRIVGARNGVHSGQVVVGTSAELAGLSARMSELAQVGGAGRIPGSAVQVRYGIGTVLASLPRAWAYGRRENFDVSALRLLGFHALDGADSRDWGFGRGWPAAEVFAEAGKIALFDHLAERVPALVPADACQPVWVTVRVPKDTAPGLYRGTLSIQAGKAWPVEVRLQVMDWALPEGRDLAAFMGLQNSLSSACVQYKCAMWSEDHWKHIERSIRMLGEVGNDLVILPLVTGGEAANEESLVPWIKKGNSFDYDWTNLDRYLDLVARHWGKKAAVVGEVCWAPPTGNGWKLEHQGVTVVEAGQKTTLKLPVPGSNEWDRVFIPFAKAVSARVKAKGFDNFHWGWFYDNANPVMPLAEALATNCPGIGWARASHEGFRGKPFPKGNAGANLDMAIRTGGEPFTKTGEPLSRQGWKNSGSVLFPRTASSVQALGQFESPMALRRVTENCIVNGLCGVGRLGADYWPPFVFANWYHPFQMFILWPGPEGAEGSVRFEALREGVQEAEVRIQLEKAGKDTSEPALSVLADRIRVIGAQPTGDGDTPMSAYHGGWQERSWDLYAAAAGAFGGRSPTAEDKALFFRTSVRAK